MEDNIAPDEAFLIDGVEYKSKDELLISLMKEKLSNCTTSEKIELIREVNTEANLDYATQNIVNRYTLSDKKDPESPNHKYPKYIGVANMLYMIDTKASTNETLEYGRKKFGKSEEWLSTVRNKPFYSQAQILSAVKSHREGFFTSLDSTVDYHKTMITQADTPVSQLNHLSDLITMSDRMDNIEKRLSKVEQENSELRLVVELQGYNIEAIHDYIGMNNSEKKSILYQLKQQGLTYKDISDKLGVSVRTLKYWMKNKSAEESAKLHP